MNNATTDILPTVTIGGHVFEPMVDADSIASIVRRMGTEISEVYRDVETLHVVVVLNGAAMFAMDLIRELSVQCHIVFVRASSYHGSMKSNYKPEFEIPDIDFTDKHVLVIEDLIDTGTTIKELSARLNTSRVASLRCAALLAKPEVMSPDIKLEFCGQEIPPVFVVGYGMDFSERGRELPHIYQLQIATNEE